VWADSTAADFTDNGANSFNIRANGGVFIFPNPPATGGTTLQLDGTNRVVLAVSSLKFKDNITDLPDSSWLYNLEGKQYNYKESPNDTNFGWVAEDVAQINDKLVNYKDGEPFSIKHLDLLPFIVEELKKLNATSTQTNDRLAKLEQKMQSHEK
jgi:hypothetical protein